MLFSAFTILHSNLTQNVDLLDDLLILFAIGLYLLDHPVGLHVFANFISPTFYIFVCSIFVTSSRKFYRTISAYAYCLLVTLTMSYK